VYFSSFFVVKKIDVMGEYFASKDSIIEAAGISIGTPLARIDSADVIQRVQEVAAVKEVEVRRVWPDRVILAVIERKPVAVTTASKGWTYVDIAGQRFGLSAAKPSNYVVVSSVDQATLKSAAEVAATAPEWLIDRVQRIRALTRDDIRIWFKNDAEIRWGSSERSERKAQVLEKLLLQKARIYDVSSPDVPVIQK
jgi:cell division protein FtsQ